MPDVGARLGARHALRLALAFCPAFLPLLPASFALICLPWLDSLEAQAQRDLVLLRPDALALHALETWTASLGGPSGLLALGALFSALYLVTLRIARAWSPWVVMRALLARHGSPRAAVLIALGAGGIAAFAIQSGSQPLARWVDIAGSIRPMGPQTLVAIALSQGFSLLALGAVAGGVVAALETARSPKARTGAAAVLLLVGAAASLAQAQATRWLAARVDARQSLARLLDVAPARLPGEQVLVLARDRAWPRAVQSGLDEVPFDQALARRAQELLDARRGWSLMATRLESYVVGERLVALDPQGAREACLAALTRHGVAAAAHPLLVSLGAAHADPPARALLGELDEASWMQRGPVALHLIARAAGLQGDRERAERALATARSVGGERRLASVRSVPPIVLAETTEGRVTGRVTMDGSPVAGRIGLVSTQDLFEIPEGSAGLPVTWLLRLGGVAGLGPDGSFAFSHVGAGEHALVLVGREQFEGVTLATPLPALVITAAAPGVALGDVRLTRAAPAP